MMVDLLECVSLVKSRADWTKFFGKAPPDVKRVKLIETQLMEIIVRLCRLKEAAEKNGCQPVLDILNEEFNIE